MKRKPKTGKYAYLDLRAIDDRIIECGKTSYEICEIAGLSKKTYERAIQTGRTGFPNACSIAYALDTKPNKIIMYAKWEESGGSGKRKH